MVAFCVCSRDHGFHKELRGICHGVYTEWVGETLVSDESGSKRHEIDPNQAFGKKLYYSANFVLDKIPV